MADRVLVMHEGRLSRELSRAEADEESVIRAATGVDGRGMSAHAAAPGEGARARRLTERVLRVRELGIVAALALLITRDGDPRAALHRDELAAQPRAQRRDLRDPRGRPDARDRHAQRRPLGRVGARAERVLRRRPAVQAPWHGAPARVPARHRARRRLRTAQRRARDVGPGPGARGDARDAVRVPRARVPVDRRQPDQRQPASRRVPQPRQRLDRRCADPRVDRARGRPLRRPMAARLPARTRAVRDRLQPRGSAPRRRALRPARADRVRAGGCARRPRRRAVHRPLRHRRRDRRRRLRADRDRGRRRRRRRDLRRDRHASTAPRSARCCSARSRRR